MNHLVEQWLREMRPGNEAPAVELVQRILKTGKQVVAGDIHLQPCADGVELRYRIDGVLQSAGKFPADLGPTIVARIKVLAELLTYRQDVPQEGRIRPGAQDRDEPVDRGERLSSGKANVNSGVGPNQPDVPIDSNVEMRVSTFPTLFGERVVIRLFAQTGKYERLDELGFSDEILVRLQQLLGETSGALLVVGPAGSGKTTTLYACLRHLVAASRFCRSIVTLEDPIEMAIEGAAQAQVRPSVDLTLQHGVRFLMRQDPEVIMVGEIRDRETAEAALQGALTGHLLLSTFHAGSSGEAISRLFEMGIEPYLLRSGLKGIVCQRLVRRLCDCARSVDPAQVDELRLGLPVESFHVPVGCDACRGTGFRGRLLIAELLDLEQPEIRRAILDHDDAALLEQKAITSGMTTRWDHAVTAVNAGMTSPGEIRRVLGVSSCYASE